MAIHPTSQSGAPMTEKQLIISKLKGQNEKLKQELKVLTMKLEEFIEKNRQKKANEKMTPGAVQLKETEKDEAVRAKESELKQSQNKIAFYKKEIDAMRRQLEGSYNIQK
jgi:predicted RNase H-like nuclease (RuvC/YqgF family)